MSNTVKIKNKKKKNEIKVNYKLWAIIFGVFVGVIVIGAVFLYGLFGGDLENKYGLIGILIICVLGVYFGVHLAWSARLSYALTKAGTDYSLGQCAFNLFELLDLAELPPAQCVGT